MRFVWANNLHISFRKCTKSSFPVLSNILIVFVSHCSAVALVEGLKWSGLMQIAVCSCSPEKHLKCVLKEGCSLPRPRLSVWVSMHFRDFCTFTPGVSTAFQQSRKIVLLTLSLSVLPCLTHVWGFCAPLTSLLDIISVKIYKYCFNFVLRSLHVVWLLYIMKVLCYSGPAFNVRLWDFSNSSPNPGMKKCKSPLLNKTVIWCIAFVRSTTQLTNLDYKNMGILF